MRTLAFKLTLAFLLVGLTGAVLVAIILQLRTRAAFDQFILNREQQALVSNLVQYYQARGSWEGVGENLQPVAFSPPIFAGRGEFHQQWARFALVDADRTIVISSIPGQDGQQAPSRDLEHAIPLEIDGEIAGWVLLANIPRQWIPNSPEGAFLANINRATLVSSLVAAALALSLGGLLAFTLTRSLRELTEATVEIAKGKLGRQVKVRTKDELGELAAAFNKMSLDLAKATQARRQMTADIAHDLRSPLSVISGYSEALSDGKLAGTPEVYNVLYQETQHLSRLVEDLRTLSLADTGELPLNIHPINPKTILERVATRYTVAAQQQGLLLRVEAGSDLPWLAVDTERIAQVFDNLVSNAFRYTSQGGEVVLAAQEVDGSVQLQVKDNGSGIPAEDIPHIFDRFYRGDKSRPQNGESGLGLAIAKSIVEAHGGIITVDSVLGQGSAFTIALKARTQSS